MNQVNNEFLDLLSRVRANPHEIEDLGGEAFVRFERWRRRNPGAHLSPGLLRCILATAKCDEAREAAHVIVGLPSWIEENTCDE